MTNVWGAAASQRSAQGGQRSQRRAMGAADRRRWSSLVRQDDVHSVLGYLGDQQLHGAVILGPRGVGKSMLARKVVQRLGAATHVVRLFGSNTATEVPYSIFSVHLARLRAHQIESPSAVLGGLVEQITNDAHGRPIIVMLDELPGIDNLSMGVLMHLVLGGKAKLLVVARTTADFPEDLVWMIKDGLLAQHRLGPFSRAEVRTLLVKALDGPVAESVVASLYKASAGNPLVLQALVHEYLSSGVLRANDGIWVPFGRLDKFSDDILLELVETRMARETEAVRRSVEKFSLFRNVPLSLALQVLGGEAVTKMEERGFLAIGSDRSKTVTFAEPYFGETVRTRLSGAQKAAYFQELTNVLSLDPATLGMQELLTLAAWISEAGMVMEPEVALAAADSALRYFDPQLALACSAHVPANHPLGVPAAQKRSRAHYMMANYAKAAEVLEEVGQDVLAALGTKEYASWAMDLTIALMWVPDEYSRIDEVLAAVELRIQEAPAVERPEAEKFLNVARFEVQVHRGEFIEAVPDLEIASKDPGDREYKLNCASLLTVALAATGRELDAVELSQAIDQEGALHNVVPRMNNWHIYGRVLALAWSGQWLTCEAALNQALEYSNEALRYRGGAMELALGVIYAFEGKHMQAAEILHISAAQLEVRDTYKSLVLAHSVLAYVYARLDQQQQARKYLARATAACPHSVWINRTLSDYFQSLALHALGDPGALARMVDTAVLDRENGRVTPAAVGLLGAVVAGAKGQYGFLEEVALNCQGELAGISTLLVQVHREKSAQVALDAAARARTLNLDDVERHANELALELARSAGETRLIREAKRKLTTAEPVQSVEFPSTMVPLTPRELQVARLAIRAMSNRDIAAKIGVSVRTVEGHLYQVFAKMGITSRAELEDRVGL